MDASRFPLPSLRALSIACVNRRMWTSATVIIVVVMKRRVVSGAGSSDLRRVGADGTHSPSRATFRRKHFVIEHWTYGRPQLVMVEWSVSLLPGGCYLCNHCAGRNATSLVYWLLCVSVVTGWPVLLDGRRSVAGELKETGQRLLTTHTHIPEM